MTDASEPQSGKHMGSIETRAAAIAGNLDSLEQPWAPTPYPKRLPPWSTPEARALRRLKRGFRRNYYAASDTSVGNLAQRGASWLLPWDLQRYPGRLRGLAQLIGVSPESVRANRGRGLLGRERLERMAREIRRRAEAGLKIAAELDAEADRRRRVGRPRGLQIIDEATGLRKHQARRGRSKRRVVEVPSV